MKICTKCGNSKDLEDFPRQHTTKDGRAPACRDCNNKRHRDSYTNNSSYKQRKITQHAIYKDRNRQFVLEYLKSHPCVDCGEVDPVVLEFDHKLDKENLISEMVTNSSLQKIQAEIAKCEVRCANCHRRKTAKDFNYYTWKAK